MARTIKDLIVKLAHDEWGAGNLNRIKPKPAGVRYRCACGQDRGLLPHRIYPEPDSEFYFDVLMSLCACGRVNYWIEWPDEEEIHQCELDMLKKACDEALRDLL